MARKRPYCKQYVHFQITPEIAELLNNHREAIAASLKATTPGTVSESAILREALRTGLVALGSANSGDSAAGGR